MCSCMSVRACMQLWAGVQMHAKTRSQWWVSSSVIFHLVFGNRVYHWVLGFADSSRLTDQWAEITCLCFPSIYITCITIHRFLQGCWGFQQVPSTHWAIPSASNPGWVCGVCACIHEHAPVYMSCVWAHMLQVCIHTCACVSGSLKLISEEVECHSNLLVKSGSLRWSQSSLI